MSQYAKLVASNATMFVRLPPPPRGLYKSSQVLAGLVASLGWRCQELRLLLPTAWPTASDEWKHIWGAASRTMREVASAATIISELTVPGLIYYRRGGLHLQSCILVYVETVYQHYGYWDNDMGS